MNNMQNNVPLYLSGSRTKDGILRVGGLKMVLRMDHFNMLQRLFLFEKICVLFTTWFTIHVI